MMLKHNFYYVVNLNINTILNDSWQQLNSPVISIILLFYIITSIS